MTNDHYLNVAIRDHGGMVYSILNSTFGGKGDGATIEDDAILNALDLIPAGSTLLFPGTVKISGVWQRATYLIDSVDMNEVTAKADIQIICRGAIMQKYSGSGKTSFHMLYDTDGAWDGLRIDGGKWDLQRDEFSNGDTVSAFFGIRNDDIQFKHMKIIDGIEEGLKLYKPVNLLCQHLWCENIRNDGVQIHTLDEGGQYTGVKSDRGAEWCRVLDSDFIDIDDGLEGTYEGQAVAVSSSAAALTTKHVWVERNKILRCIRGPWAEFNIAGYPGEHIHLNNNQILENRWFGVGLIGVRGGSVVGNRVKNLGVMAPTGGTSSEVAGLVISGGSDPKGTDNIVTENVILELRGGSSWMEYGIIVNSQQRTKVTGNKVYGATVAPVLVDWGTGKVEKCDVYNEHVPAVDVYNSAGQTIADDDLDENLTFDTQVKDIDENIGGVGAWAASPNPERVYFRTPGLYMCYANATFNPDATGLRRLRLLSDNGITSTIEDEDEKTPRSDQECSLHVQALIEVTEAQIDTANGFYIRASIYQDSGSGLNVVTGKRCRLGFYYVGPRV